MARFFKNSVNPTICLKSNMVYSPMGMDFLFFFEKTTTCSSVLYLDWQ